MHPAIKTLVAASLAFCLPLLAVVVLHWDSLEERMTVDPRTAAGKLLYFTAPG